MLYRSGLLDPAPDASFDRVVRLAARLLQAPIALVSAISDDCEAVKSAVGLPEAWAVAPGFSFALCRRVVEHEAPLAIEDTEAHPLTHDLPALAELGVAAYLGVPLRSRSGPVLGSLCVMDTEPRAWPPDAIQSLEDLAAILSDEMEARELARRLDEERRAHAVRRARTEGYVDAITDLFFVLDLQGRFADWNQRVLDVTGYSDAELARMNPLTLIDEADQDRVVEAMVRSLEHGEAAVEVVLVAKDGRRIPYEFNGTPLYDPDGQLLGMCGTARDITDRREAAARLAAQTQALREAHDRFEAVTNNVPGVVYQAIYERDGSLTIPFVRAGIGRHLGVDFSTLQDHPERLFELIHPDDIPSFEASIERSRDGLKPWTWVGRFLTPDGIRWISAASRPTRLGGGRVLWDGILVDVTAQKEAEEALRLSEARHRGLLEATPDLFFRLNRAGVHLDVKTSNPDHLAVDLDRIVGHSVSELLPEEVAGPWMQALHAALDTGEVQQVEYELDTLSGHARHFEARLVPIAEDEVQAIVRDVTDRNEAEEALRTSEIRFRTFVETTAQIVWYSDADSRIVQVSDAWGGFTGIPSDHLTGSLGAELRWAKAIHPEDRPRFIEEWQFHRETRTPHHTELRFRRHDGVYHRFQIRSVPVFDGDEFHGWVGTCIDVEEQHRAAQALALSEERLRLALEGARMGMWDVDLPNQTAVWSHHTFALYGLSPDAFDGRETAFYDLIHPEDAARIQATTARALKRAATGGTPQLQHEYRLPRPDGEVRWFRSMGRIQLDEAGQPVRMLGVVLDITDEKEYEAALIESKEAAEQARAQAEEVARLKGALLANMSHEIRTPLTGIIGFAELIAEEAASGEPSPDHEEFALRIGLSGRRLLETLNSVLDLAQIEADQSEPTLDEADLCTLVAETLELLRPRAEDQGLELELSLPPHPVPLRTDRGALGRAVMNIVSNAIKFTPSGSVSVDVTASDEEAVVRVTDTGVGIDPAFLPRLFEAFRQESEGEGRSFEGSGLGLAITQRLLEMLGGSLSVESEKGVGSTFTIHLPLAA